MSFFSSASSPSLKLELSDFAATAAGAAHRSRMSGFMEKRGQKGGATKKRFFCLDGNCLFYYASVDPKSVVGMIWVEGCSVDAVDELTLRLVTLGQVSHNLKALRGNGEMNSDCCC